MPNRADFTLDEPALDKAGDKLVRGYLSAGTRAVSNTTKRLERNFEEVTKAAVKGNLYRAWGSRTYPKSGGPARNPAGEVFINGGARTRTAMKYFTEPGRVTGKDGGSVAIPLPAAGVRRRDPMMTPERWEAIHGMKLIPIQRRGRPMILAAPGRATGRNGTFRKISREQTSSDRARGYMRGEQLVPIFVIMPDLPHKNNVAILPLIQRAKSELPAEFVTEASKVR